ncbi:class I SAM-dependent DNA methyltransferase [Lederbergia lenta]|uniref:class I SAM-dependent DNA methyltransferase n=1 Tax=Lederbergia lenta TaxID=1467 RepID=UPI00203D67DD|nr:class I SAM-dependent methyltransferase [Lederbergia lenta]MCM3112382.1 class I SAM-dependent methyltransferase [Lederbergia lenta]
MTDSMANFYNDLAEEYHLIYSNWDYAIDQQGSILDHIISGILGNVTETKIAVLDCSCGIGTQAIGLAKRGYVVTGTDISNSSILRARREANLRNVSINFNVADLRSLQKDVGGVFDVVLSADNALPHLLTDEDLSLAFQNLSSKLRQNGVLILTLRDYDKLITVKPRVTQTIVFDEGKRITFQVWNWIDDLKIYQLLQFILQDMNGKWEMKSFSTTYRALLRAEVDSLLKFDGFTEVEWHMPEKTGFHQPIVTARKS